jgi:hypothetical protein
LYNSFLIYVQFDFAIIYKILVHEIAASSIEQKNGAEQVNVAIQQLSQVTHELTAMD